MKPVPMPFSRRWHEFRTVYLPVISFLFVFAAMLVIWRFIIPRAIVANGIELGVETANVPHGNDSPSGATIPPKVSHTQVTSSVPPQESAAKKPSVTANIPTPAARQ